MTSDSLLDVVIVNYNSFEDCKICIGSLLKEEIVPIENIIVVDNNSPDGSGKQLRTALDGAQIILSDTNAGFGSGVNLGVQAATSPYVLVLNPDTRFEENRIGEALHQFEIDPKLGVLGLNLVNPDGSLQYSARRFYSIATIIARRTLLGKSPFGRRLVQEHLMMNAWEKAVFEADWVMGTGFVVRRDIFERLNGMDEDFFLYLEDTAFCASIWRNGYKVKAIRDVKLIHDHQRKSAASPFSPASKTHLRSLYLFIKKFGMPLFGHGARPASARSV